MRIRALLTLMAALLLLSLMPAVAASADVNPNPIRWEVFRTYYRAGADVPLRYGQNDAGPIDGFGTRHIEDGHGEQDWDYLGTLIQQALDSGSCSTSGTTVSCHYGATYETILIYSTRVDPDSGDGRPVGVITAYQICQACRPDQ